MLCASLPRVYSAYAHSAQFERRRRGHGLDGEGVRRDLLVKMWQRQFRVCPAVRAHNPQRGSTSLLDALVDADAACRARASPLPLSLFVISPCCA
jgi:hypothetical protein